ncbi:MBL fold metallo-hydrolase [Pedobacter sp. MC2016-05]|uniref:MBL fold metallo-hydrolase n=1 Tax=Pedobacter sp. MC2016-05 TaxID=2994474 RepID=UPI002245C3B3|nr:MBL fold metallo-hydrolase [Pedobacter sp. MC2016-05]MCX2474434.1 MBL fold metallo-hydrolase [Pedobacter sp. MC2016-05]
MEKISQSEDNHFIPMTSSSSYDDGVISGDVYYYTNQIVNIAMVGKPGESWFLVDAGMPTSGKEILKVATERFGERKPDFILLTHGHFDHVGGLVELLENWQVPVYAHQAEFPFLNGTQDYPEPDDTVEGGLLAKISSLYPHKAINIAPYLEVLPENQTLPGFEDWSWIHTPGHSPGHISIFRPIDRVLISGDAIVTVRPDSLYKVLFQIKEVNGPPRYLTTDWDAAHQSVKTLASLDPEFLLTGHGQVMEGEEMRSQLKDLAENFHEKAVPKHGRFS